MRRGGKALLIALAVAASGDARAQDEEPPPPAQRAAGTYQGVAPGEGGPERRKPRHGRTPTVTWLGFQPQPGGGARVFVQLDRAVPHEQAIHGGALVISLAGARAAHSNNRRFLDTRFFDTAVDRVSIERARPRPGKRRAAGLELVIRFKDPAAAREGEAAMQTGKDGYTYLTVDLPRAGVGTARAQKQ